MIEIELFLKTVEAQIRKNHVGYVKGLKRVPLNQDNVKGFVAFIKWLFCRKSVPVEDKLLKGYNAGIEKALKVLETEYKRFIKRVNQGDFNE